MASIINASSTGSGGIVQTADASGVLQLQSNGTVGITVNTSGYVAFRDATVGTTALTLRAIANTYAGGALALQDAAGTSKTYITSISNTTFFGDNTAVDCAGINQYGIGIGASIPTSGKGIMFPATQSASSNANTLDDYEEGTFTVGVRGAGTAGTYTITSQTCSYTKIGNLVSLTIWVVGFSAASGGTSYMQITGLPFTNNNVSKGSITARFLDYSANTLFVTPAFIGSSAQTTLYLEENKDAASGADFDISGVSTSSNFQLTITYATT